MLKKHTRLDKWHFFQEKPNLLKLFRQCQEIALLFLSLMGKSIFIVAGLLVMAVARFCALIKNK
jgi:hypothetical protein